MQIWVLDENNFYTEESKLVSEEELKEVENYTDVPLLVGCVKPKFLNGEWIEGATEEEIQAWKDSQTNETNNLPSERELIEQLRNDNAALAENVYALAEVLEIMITGGTESAE